MKRDKQGNRIRKNYCKDANHYGGDYNCPNYQISTNGNQWCHDQYPSHPITMPREYIDGVLKLRCKGNRHRCIKFKYKWFASLSDRHKQFFRQNGYISWR